MASRPRNPPEGWARPQYVIPFAILAIGWGIDGHRKVATLEANQAQRPDLVERRNREMDALQRCIERQMDIMRSCQSCGAGGD